MRLAVITVVLFITGADVSKKRSSKSKHAAALSNESLKVLSGCVKALAIFPAFTNITLNQHNAHALKSLTTSCQVGCIIRIQSITHFQTDIGSILVKVANNMLATVDDRSIFYIAAVQQFTESLEAIRLVLHSAQYMLTH